MNALILSAMLCGSAEPDDRSLLNSEEQKRIAIHSVILDLRASIFYSRLLDVVQGKQPPVKILKSGVNLAIAYETRIELRLFGSTATESAATLRHAACRDQHESARRSAWR